ncbi:MAG TPA: septal ring lytic transglycosylase RlpA family protein, partial [Methyloversatilis sp.]
VLVALAVLAGCAGAPAPAPEPGPVVSEPARPAVVAPKPAAQRGGGYYLDDGPGDNPPDEAALATIPDATPREEPMHRFANRPYSALGMQFVPMTEPGPFRQRGRGSWYGRKFHGQKTSSGEIYDMYGMTAAHATLPIPSYARVTNPGNGRSVVVRINDRGPFKPGRVIDLSWTAAAKLGYAAQGSTEVEVEAVFAPGSPADLLARRAAGQPVIDRPVPAQTPAAQTSPAPRDDVVATLAAGTAPTGSHWLQLGAFSALDNAQALSRRAAEALTGLTEQVSVSSDGMRHRVQAGPFASRDAAQSAARTLRERLGLEALLITR